MASQQSSPSVANTPTTVSLPNTPVQPLDPELAASQAQADRRVAQRDAGAPNVPPVVASPTATATATPPRTMADIQSEMDAVQYGQSLADEVASNRADYADLDDIYDGLDDVTAASSRREFVTPALDTLYSTIEVGAEAETLYGIMGKTVTVTVFSADGAGGYRMRATYVIPIIQPD